MSEAAEKSEKAGKYETFLETCLGGSITDTDAHDKHVLGLKGAICAVPEDDEKESDGKEKDISKKETECFALDDSDNDSSGFSDDDDEEWDLEDAYNFDPEKLAELLQKGGKIDEEELVETMQESMAEAFMMRMQVDDPDLESQRPDCSGTLDGRMTPPPCSKDFDAPSPLDPKVVAEKLEMKDRRRSSIGGRRNINDAVKTNTARTRKSIACVAAEKMANGEEVDKAKIELAAEKTTKRHRMSLCKAAETLDLAGLGDEDPEEVKEKLKIVSKCLMVARGRHRMTVAAVVKETVIGDDEEAEKVKEAAENASKDANGPKAKPKPKFMSKLRASAKEFVPSAKQQEIKDKIAAAVAAAYKRNGKIEKPEKSEVKEEWTTAYEDMSVYDYNGYGWGQTYDEYSYGWENCNQMAMANQMGQMAMANQMSYDQSYQMGCQQYTGCGQMACNQWQGNQWQSQGSSWTGNQGSYDAYGNYLGDGYGNDYNNCYYNNGYSPAQTSYGGTWSNAAWGSA